MHKYIKLFWANLIYFGSKRTKPDVVGSNGKLIEQLLSLMKDIGLEQENKLA